MHVGMIGLGRMGSNMAQRLLRGGHACTVFDSDAARVASMIGQGATGASSLGEFMTALHMPRVVWLMLPAAVVDTALDDLSPHLQPGDVVVDGGNSHYIDDVRRAKDFGARGIHYVDAGVSGGVWGLERGYCLMIGGDSAAVGLLDPVFRTLAPGVAAAAPHFGHLGQGEVVLIVLGMAEGCRFGVHARRARAGIGVREDVQAFRICRHERVFDPVVHHLHEVSCTVRSAVQPSVFRR